MRIIFFTLLIFSFKVAFAEQANDLFAEGNVHYQAGEFELAIEKYELIRSNGMESGELYYNLANAYYKINKLGRARLNYERALEILEGDEAVEQNLELLKSRLVDQIEEPPRLLITEWWMTIINMYNMQTLAIVLLTFLWLTLISAGIFIYFRKRGRIKFKGIFLSFLFCMIFVLTIWLNKIYLFETEKHGVILIPTVTVYAEPAENTTELFVIHEGTEVSILRSSGNWLEVRLIDGKTGWLVNEVLDTI